MDKDNSLGLKLETKGLFKSRVTSDTTAKDGTLSHVMPYMFLILKIYDQHAVKVGDPDVLPAIDTS